MYIVIKSLFLGISTLILLGGCDISPIEDYPVQYKSGCVTSASGAWVCKRKPGLGVYKNVFRGERLSKRAALILNICNYPKDKRHLHTSGEIRLRRVQNDEDLEEYKDLTGEDFNEYKICRG